MDGTGDTFDCGQAGETAAYVLGALEPTEYELYREHLHNCTVCQEDVIVLQPVVDALATDTLSVRITEALRERVMSRVRADAALFHAAGPDADRPLAAHQRQHRHRTLVAVGGAIAIGTATGALLIAGPMSIPASRTVQATLAPSHPGARAELRQTGQRAELIVSDLPQPALGEIYEVWLSRPGQAPQPTDALFSVDGTGSGSVDVPGKLHGTERLIVTAEPLGGTRRPTSPAIIEATL